MAGSIPRPKDDYITNFPLEIKLQKDKTALVIVDMQYATACRFTGLGKWLKETGKERLGKYRFDRIENIVVPNIIKILNFCRENSIRVIYLTFGSEMSDYSDMVPHKRNFARICNNTLGKKEHEILDELQPLKDEYVINKLSVGAFNSSNIEVVLRSMEIEYLLFTGVSTHICVDLTAKCASERGYKCVLIEDCLGATKVEYHNYGLIVFQRSFGRVDSLKNIINELSKDG
jgi:biuret amidohydrolase